VKLWGIVRGMAGIRGPETVAMLLPTLFMRVYCTEFNIADDVTPLIVSSPDTLTGIGIGVGVGVGSGVNIGTSVGYGVNIGVSVGYGVNVGTGVDVGVGIGVGVRVGTTVGVGVGIGVNVGIGDGVGTNVDIGVGAGVNIGIGVDIIAGCGIDCGSSEYDPHTVETIKEIRIRLLVAFHSNEIPTLSKIARSGSIIRPLMICAGTSRR